MRPAATLLVSLLSGNLTACALDQPPQMDETVQAIEESPDPGDAPSTNAGSIPPEKPRDGDPLPGADSSGVRTHAGSIPPTNPKGGESLPGNEDDPQSSAASPASSVQGLVELGRGKAPPDRMK